MNSAAVKTIGDSEYHDKFVAPGHPLGLIRQEAHAEQSLPGRSNPQSASIMSGTAGRGSAHPNHAPLQDQYQSGQAVANRGDWDYQSGGQDHRTVPGHNIGTGMGESRPQSHSRPGIEVRTNNPNEFSSQQYGPGYSPANPGKDYHPPQYQSSANDRRTIPGQTSGGNFRPTDSLDQLQGSLMQKSYLEKYHKRP